MVAGVGVRRARRLSRHRLRSGTVSVIERRLLCSGEGSSGGDGGGHAEGHVAQEIVYIDKPGAGPGDPKR